MPIETRKGQIKVNRGTIVINEDIQSELYLFSNVTFYGGNTVSAYRGTLDSSNVANYYSYVYRERPDVLSWITNSNYLTINADGMHEWVVPKTGTYYIGVVGASSGTCYQSYLPPNYGQRSSIDTRFNLIKGQVLKILVGLAGSNSYSTCAHAAGGGGGGTFVVDKDSGNPIVIVGGAGAGSYDVTGPYIWFGDSNSSGRANTGYQSNVPTPYGIARFYSAGNRGTGFNMGTPGGDSPSGVGGSGVGLSPSCVTIAGAGGGFSTPGGPGVAPIDTYGKSFISGGLGGFSTRGPGFLEFGGFGGGGADCSGNGYTGGGGGGFNGGGNGGLDTCSCSDLGGGGGGGIFLNNEYWNPSPSGLGVPISQKGIYPAGGGGQTNMAHYGSGYVTIEFIE